MKTINKIADKIYLIEGYNGDRTKVEYTILVNNQMKPLVTLDNLFKDTIVAYKYNEFYLMVYSCNHNNYGVPPVVEAIYDIKNDKMIDPNEDFQFTYGIEDMFLYQRSFRTSTIIQVLNPNYKLELCPSNEVFEMLDFLRGENHTIPYEDVIKYILKVHPELQEFTHITKPLTVLEYQVITKDRTSYYFNSIPQNLDFIKDQRKLTKKNNG